jgi:hypothetical protein
LVPKKVGAASISIFFMRAMMSRRIGLVKNSQATPARHVVQPARSRSAMLCPGRALS